MVAHAPEVHLCWKCARRLNVDQVRGSVVVLCPRCKVPNQIQQAAGSSRYPMG